MGVKKVELEDRGGTLDPLPKRILIVKQSADNKFGCYFQGIEARQFLLPMLRAAEKQFRVTLNRRAIQDSNESGKLI